MARSWLQRAIFGADGSVASAGNQLAPTDALDAIVESFKPRTPARPSLRQMQKALGQTITESKDGDEWKGLDWDEEASSMFFAGDKPAYGHPGANFLSYPTLRSAAGLSIIAPFIMKRVQQMVEYSRPQQNRYAPGAKICLRESKPMTKVAEREVRDLWAVFNRHEPFHQTVARWSNDSWTYDQANGEIIYEKGNRPYAFRALDASTIRRGRPKLVEAKNDAERESNLGKLGRMESNTYVQMVRDRVQRVWAQEEMMWIIRRPRTDIYTFGYGYPEIQQAHDAIMSYLAADDYNNYFFKNGMHASGILQVFSKMDRKTWNAFKMMMTAQLKGVENAHRMAMVLLDGSSDSKEKIEKVDLGDKTNRDLEFTKLITMKTQIIAANFNMSPDEVGLPKFSDAQGGGGIRNDGNKTEQIALSRKMGLMPALIAFEDALNERIVKPFNEDFEFKFVYDEDTEENRLEMGSKAIQAGIDSQNEQRLEMDRPVIDRKLIKSWGGKWSDQQIDGILLAVNLPMTPTMIQALSVLTPQAPQPAGGVGPDGQPLPDDGQGQPEQADDGQEQQDDDGQEQQDDDGQEQQDEAQGQDQAEGDETDNGGDDGLDLSGDQ